MSGREPCPTCGGELRLELKRLLEPLLRGATSDQDIILTIKYLLRLEGWFANRLRELGVRAQVFYDSNVIGLCVARRVSVPELPKYGENGARYTTQHEGVLD